MSRGAPWVGRGMGRIVAASLAGVAACTVACSEAPRVEPTRLGPPPSPVTPASDARTTHRDAARACIEAAGPRPPAQRAVVRAFCAELARNELPGAALVLISADQPPLELARGVRCTGSAEPVDLDTPFRLGSLTKPFTALALLELEAEGELELGDPLGRHLEELRGTAWAGVTLRALLQHTAGAPEPTPPLPSGSPTAWIEALARDHPPREDPGWRYANLHHVLLGEVVARHRGAPWGEVVASRLLGPLGLTHTSAAPGTAKDPACGHLAPTSPGIPIEADALLMSGGAPWARPAGAMLGTARELATFARRHRDPDPHSALGRALARMLEDAMPAERGQQQTLGWRRLPGEGPPVYAHAGATAHFSAELYFSPELDFAFAYTANRNLRLRATVIAALEAFTGAQLTSAAAPSPGGVTDGGS